MPAKQSLKTYNQKRNFKVTPEPEGKIATKSGNHFFIQKHDASHLHFDFRLELDGVLKSWAVPKGPSVIPGIRRLAMEVEDHPLSYGDFEGTIPQGEYGGGTVMLWDKGTWTPDTDPKKALKTGKLSFELNGERLKGAWTLVRKENPDSKKNMWFLIKRKDGSRNEKEPVEKFTTSVSSDRKMKQIAEENHEWLSKTKKKNLRPFKLPAHFKPELASLVDHAPEGDEWAHEIKFDGYRIVTLVKANQVRFFTRNGLDWTDKLSSLVSDVEDMKLGDAILDGELIVPDEKGKSNFQALQNAFKKNESSKMIYYVFDLVSYKRKDLSKTPLAQRKKQLADVFANSKSKSKSDKILISDFIVGQGQKLFAEASRLGLEGIVSKRLDSVYRYGRTEDWLKIKSLLRQEFIVVGYTKPGGSREHFGALLLAAYNEQGQLQYVGRSGTGFDSKLLSSLKAKFEKITLKKELEIFDPFKEIGNKSGITWLKPKLVAEFKFATWTQHKILRQSVFLGLRLDKEAKDVKLETVKKVEKITKKRGTSNLTKPDKILFSPDITKQDLADYYSHIEKWVMPHLSKVPLSILRCPDGHDKFCFFQKHTAAPPPKSSGILRKKSNEFMYVDSLAGLLSLVQLGVLEVHQWQTHVDHLEKPDQIVFDLDPDPGVSWKKVIETAFRIRDRLTLLKLKSFVKTTGGKGVHIVCPIEPKKGWDDVKSFTKSFAEALENEFPDEYTSNMAKKKREKKIFIDYLRNGRGATSVMPYSTRAKAHAPISTPVTWDELENVASADFFTIRNIEERLSKLKKDPWADFFKLRQQIPKI